jgi:ArsR family transcriptional regulator
MEMYANAFKALANPHRLQIFNILSSCCEPGTACSTEEAFSCCVGELAPKLDIAASTLSHHLKELNQAGLIDMRRDGKQIFCSVNRGMLKEIRILFKLYERNTQTAKA